MAKDTAPSSEPDQDKEAEEKKSKEGEEEEKKALPAPEEKQVLIGKATKKPDQETGKEKKKEPLASESKPPKPEEEKKPKTPKEKAPKEDKLPPLPSVVSPEPEIKAYYQEPIPWAKIIIFAFIFMLLLDVLLFSLWYFKKSKAQTPPPQVGPTATPTSRRIQPTSTPPPTSTPAPRVPDDWQAYQNKEYHFEFRYPQDYLLSTRSFKIFSEESLRPCGLSLIKAKNKGLSQPPTICLSLIETVKSPQKYLDDDHQAELTDWESRQKVKGFEIKPAITSNQTVRNNSLTAQKVIRQRTATSLQFKEVQYLFKHGDLLYLLSVRYGGYIAETGEDGSDEREVLDKIFSSFRFLEEPTPPESSPSSQKSLF